jgi:GNAT superfamily N-acetyltransferase
MSEVLITPFRPEDRARWAELWRGYLEFYETILPDEIYQHTWARLIAPDSPIFGFGARLGDDAAPLVGITHYLFHASCWTPKEICYLQYLFVDQGVRGKGCGRALIERVAAAARERDCLRLYWSTKEDNATARLLYDRLARFTGFIRYDFALP